MNQKNKRIIVGEYVKISQKNGDISVGMVRNILRDSEDGVIVELINGLMGRVIDIVPSRAKISIKKRLISPKQILTFRAREIPEKELFSGERKDLEYKLSALWSQDLSRDELESMKTPEVKKYGNRSSKIIIAKVIAGFLNTSGGNLLIGVKEEKKQGSSNVIVGIDAEFSKLKNKDFGEDGYRRMIIDDIIRSYFPKEIFNHFNNYLQISFLKRNEKTLCMISVKRSESEVFISIANEDHFFIRVDTQTRELKGKETVDYIRRHFK